MEPSSLSDPRPRLLGGPRHSTSNWMGQQAQLHVLEHPAVPGLCMFTHTLASTSIGCTLISYRRLAR